MKFDEILGNQVAKEVLLRQIYNNELNHSYIFVGREGIGKRLIGREFARKILCNCEDKHKTCETCESCIKFESDNHPDFTIIYPDGNYIKISQIRQMQEDVYKKPIVSKKKVFIIDEAEFMTEEAQNCLLKTLEEPPEYIVIVLIVSNESLLLNTIKSRCIKISFQNLSDAEILDYIHSNDIIESPSKYIIKLCDGSIGKLRKIVENLDIYREVEKITKYIIVPEKCSSMIDLLKDVAFLYQEKEKINLILEYMIVIIYAKINEEINNGGIVKKCYFKMINTIQNTIIKLKTNANYDMCIDEMIFNLYNERTEII